MVILFLLVHLFEPINSFDTDTIDNTIISDVLFANND